MREALFYILSSFWAGAVHAATPGHGKTIAAAYIVGARVPRVRPDARKNGQTRPLDCIRTARCAGGRLHRASVLRECRKSAKIHAGLGVIWGIPVYQSPNERTISRMLRRTP